MPCITLPLLLLLLLLAVACEPRGQTSRPPTAAEAVSTTQPSSREAERLDVLEAVFRHQFDNNASGMQRNADCFYLALDDRMDPPPELLDRFKAEKPPVLPVSRATFSKLEGSNFNELDGRGVIFNVTSIRWLSEDEAEAEGGYWEGSLSSSGNTYRVTRIKGEWKVTKDDMNYIS